MYKIVQECVLGMKFLLLLSYFCILCNSSHTRPQYVQLIPKQWEHSWIIPMKYGMSYPHNYNRGSRAALPKLLPMYFELDVIDVPPITTQEPVEELEDTAPFKIIYQWKKVDFQYPNEDFRISAIKKGEFIPDNNLPLGMDTWRNRIFITLPRWKKGVPASLVWLPIPPVDESPKMTPYPSWGWHSGTKDCDKIISVFRINVDDCGRLWVLDSGLIDVTISPKQSCPPKLMVFDLRTDNLLMSYHFPKDQIKEDSLFSNILVDIRDGICEDAYAYVTDVWRFGILVFSWRTQRSWRTNSHLFFPDPFASDYSLHDVNFQWTDGVFGISLAPVNLDGDRVLFFHPMSSFYEFQVSSSVLRNETAWKTAGTVRSEEFQVLGYRGLKGQSSASAVDRDGVMFYNLVLKDSVGCWDLRKPYDKNTLGIVGSNFSSLIFPNDLKVDHEYNQGLWVLSNRLPEYLYKGLDYNEYNFRILRASTKEAVHGTVCDPLYSYGGQQLS